jgi:hypothetical protein
MQDHPTFKAVEMTRRIRDDYYAELTGKTPEERIAFYREKARALHAELGRPEELPYSLEPGSVRRR